MRTFTVSKTISIKADNLLDYEWLKLEAASSYGSRFTITHDDETYTVTLERTSEERS